MFSDEQLTTSYRLWAVILICLVLFMPLSLEPVHLNKQVRARLEMQNAAAATAREPAKTPGKQPVPETIVQTLVLAWNRGDSEAVARMFLPNGVLIIPTGSVIRSRNEIRKRILEERRGRLKESTLRNTVEDVSVVDANTALVRGQYTLDGVKILGVKTSPAGSYVLRQKKLQGAWLIEKAEVLGKKESH